MTKVQEIEIKSLQAQREKLLIAALEAGGSIYKEDLEIGSSIETLFSQIRLLCDLGYAWETDERLTLTSEGLAVARKILDYQLIA